MAAFPHRRQVLLFLAAILVPCAALVAIGLRLVVQERELDRARLGDEQRRVTALLRQELASELERTALRQASAVAGNPEILRSADYGDSTVVLVAGVSGGRLILPWERDDAWAEARRQLDRDPFASRLRQAERVELAADDPVRAAGLYRRALDAADHPVQAVHTRLYLARSLARAGRADEAIVRYSQVSAADPALVDPHGVPVTLYAARRLVELGVADTTIERTLRGVVSLPQWLPPEALYLLRDVTDRLAAAGPDTALATLPDLRRQVAGRLARTRQALELGRAFPGLGLASVDAPTGAGIRGVPFGSPPWLVGVAPLTGQDLLVIAVLAEPVLGSLQSGTRASGAVVGRVVPTEEVGPGGEPLGVGFPGLSVHLGVVDRPAGIGSARWWLYAAGLALVLGVTLFGAYLLWRDTQRELALAETRSRFVSAVSHELKTPLSAIRMFAETLHMGRPADPAARREYLETIVSESERLTRLLNNVLDFSKIEEGRKTYRRERQSLAEIVRFSARAMRYPLEQQQFVLHVEVDDDVPQAPVDRDAIEQAILNLLANAMKYSGGSRDIGLRLRSENGAAVIEVSDRGVGIDAAEQDRIFERYYRVPSATGNGVPGAGLGLTLVRHIAEAHGGRVAVESAPGEGSTFSLFIPLEESEP